MPKTLKIVLAVVIAALVLVSGFLGYILFGTDPSDYKAQLEQAARDQGIELKIQGDIGMSLYPSLAINAEGISLVSEVHQIRPSSVASVALKLDWLPLLKNQVVINALTIEGADLHLDRLEQAAAIASAPVAAIDAQQAAPADSPLALAIGQFEVNNSKITLHNPDGSSKILDAINLSMLGPNAAGQASPVALSLEYPLEDSKITLSLEGEVAYSQASEKIEIPRLHISADGLLKEQLSARLAVFIDLKADTADIQLLSSGTTGLSLSGNIKASQLTDDLQIEGQLAVDSPNFKQALEAITGTAIVTANPEVLQKMHLQTAFSGNSALVTLQDLQLALDSTTIKGAGRHQFGETNNLSLSLTGDQFNLDHYQAPDEPAQSAQEPAANQPPETAVAGEKALLAPFAGILASLDGGTAAIDLTFDSLIVDDTVLAKPRATILVDGDKLSIAPLHFGLHDGQVETTMALNLADKPTALTFNLAVADLDIAQAQRHWTGNTDLSGRLTLNLQGSTSGETSKDLLDRLAATGNVATQNLHLASVNVEQSYCELAQLIEENPPRETPWPPGTNLDDLAGQFTIAGRTILLKDYITRIGNLKIRGTGTIQLDQEKFDMDVIANLQGDRTSESGCMVKSKRIRNRDIPLHCKDSFADASARSCKPDSDFVKEIVQKELLDKFLKPAEDGEEKPLESLLKGLFGR